MILLRAARLAFCLVALCAVAFSVPASAQPQVERPKVQDDAWDFADEDVAEPTLLELARPQAVDVGLFIAFVVLAMVSFFRKSERLKYVTLVASVVYLGVYKSQLISIVNVFGLITANLPVFSYNLAWYSFAIFTVASTVLWGRLYCGRVCAFGAFTQLLDRVVPSSYNGSSR